MKKSSLLSGIILLILLAISIKSKAQDIRQAAGTVIETSMDMNLGFIKFTLIDDVDEHEISFMLYKGQFGIEDPDQLAGRQIILNYLHGSAPVAIGMNKSSEPFSMINLLSGDFYLGEHEQILHFVGLFKGAMTVNYETVFTVEGAYGRSEEFALPTETETEPFYDGTFENQEWIVSYVLVDDNYILDLEWSDAEEAEAVLVYKEEEESSFTGFVTNYSDSGLGPYYNLELKNWIKKETFSALVDRGLMPQLEESKMIGKKIRVDYQISFENHMISVFKASQFDQGNIDREGGGLIARGQLEYCQIGDVSGYLSLKDSGGVSISFTTDFECPENIKEGDAVVVVYREEKSIEISQVSLVK